MKDQLLLAQEITDCEQLFADDFTSSGLNEETQKHLDAHMEGVSPTSTSETPSANLSCDNVGVHISGAIASPSPSAPPSTLQRKQVSRVGVSKTGIKRGSYNCGRCGLPKKGHICTHIDTNNTPLERDRVITPSQSHSQSQSQSDSANTRILDRSGCTRNRSHPLVDTPSHSNVNAPHSYCASPAFHLARQTSSVCGAKRSLSMPRGGGGCPDEGKGKGKEIRPTHLNVHGSKRIHCGRSSASSSTPSYSSNRPALDAEMDSVDSTHLPDQSAAGLLSATCIVEIFKRLPPSSLLVATTVCTQWAQCARHVWSSVTDTQLLVTHHQKRCIPVMLKNCPNLMHLVLDVKSEIDDYLLRSIACSTHHLASLEIQVSHGGINMVTGDGLNDLLSECDSLYSLKLESCKAIRSLHLCSTHLATLWMADCYSIRTMFINCPSLTELSLDFAPEDDGSTDLCNVIENLSQSCPRLSRLHVSSVSLNNSVVLALASSNFRFLSMLSLTFGSGITDASVAALASSWNNLQMLDLSGSSITDRGLGIICSAFSGTMSKLLIALCRQISIAGLQMVVTQLPFLELLDCGMTIDYECHTNGNEATSLVRLQQEKYEVQQGGNILSKANTISNRLVIKHSRLKKLSLWGCSGIHALYLDCPELVELNLNSCSSLSPENMLLQCPALLAVHAAYCEKVVTCAFQSKVSCSTEKETLHFSTKRMADGSKRVQAPQFDIIQPCEYGEVEEDVQKCLQGLTPPV